MASGRPAHLARPCLGSRPSRPLGGREGAASSVRRWRGQRDGPVPGIGVGRWRGRSGAAAGRMSPVASRWPCYAISRSLCPGVGMKQPPGRVLAVKPVTRRALAGPLGAVVHRSGPVLASLAFLVQVCALDQRHVASGSDRSTRVARLVLLKSAAGSFRGSESPVRLGMTRSGRPPLSACPICCCSPLSGTVPCGAGADRPCPDGG